jgi:hypothetical protein
MIRYIWNGKPGCVVERYRQLQDLALSMGEDQSLVESVESYNRNLWMRHLNEGATYLPV